MLSITQHNSQVFTDYEMLRSFNIRTVRDGTIWPQIERSGSNDFSSLLPMLQTWDMMSGQVEPELGGHPRYLDIMGANYYHANQWEYPDRRLRWEDRPRDERWVPLHRLLSELYDRYRRPLFIGETSHFGAGRGRWIREIYDEVLQAMKNSVPMEGITIYPIIDRPDRDDLDHWHNSGLWDLHPDEHGTLQRVLNEEYAAALREIQRDGALPERGTGTGRTILR